MHIFYEFYTHTHTDADTGNGFVLYQTDAHAAGRQKDGQTDRGTGLQAALHLLQRKAQRRNVEAHEVIKGNAMENGKIGKMAPWQ